MFETGQYIVCGNNGVCRVEGTGSLDMPGADRHREYYFLTPVYGSGSRVYVPVDTEKNRMRRVLSREEADELLRSFDQMEPLKVTDEKAIEREYRETIRKNDCREWCRVIKTIQYRRKKRSASGSKITATDSRYYKIAGDRLYGELALVLGMDRQDVEKYVIEHL